MATHIQEMEKNVYHRTRLARQIAGEIYEKYLTSITYDNTPEDEIRIKKKEGWDEIYSALERVEFLLEKRS